MRVVNLFMGDDLVLKCSIFEERLNRSLSRYARILVEGSKLPTGSISPRTIAVVYIRECRMRRRTAIAVVLIVGLLSGCASTPISNQVATPVAQDRILNVDIVQYSAEKVEVTVKRDSGFFGSACSSRVFVDSKPVADIRPTEKVVMYLSKDQHIISASPNGICSGGIREIEADLRSGKPATFRLGYGPHGDTFIYRTAF